MCIYWVMQYECGHFADVEEWTILSHCREFDTALRYWNNQADYMPVELATTTGESQDLQKMPKPCRPIWPIPFPGDQYLPVPDAGKDYPSGLARPYEQDKEVSATGFTETRQERKARQDKLIEGFGTFAEVAAHQDSLTTESKLYRATFPPRPVVWSTGARGNDNPFLPQEWIEYISLYASSRSLASRQQPTVLILDSPFGCQHTLLPACNQHPNATGMQDPRLLATRITLHNRSPDPRFDPGTPEALFLRDFSQRGGAKSYHDRNEPRGSELTKTCLVTEFPLPSLSAPADGLLAVAEIPRDLYLGLHAIVPPASFASLLGGEGLCNPHAPPFAPVEELGLPALDELIAGMEERSRLLGRPRACSCPPVVAAGEGGGGKDWWSEGEE